jgi:hypothetical protein
MQGYVYHESNQIQIYAQSRKDAKESKSSFEPGLKQEKELV